MDQTEAIREVVDQPALDRDGETIGRVVEVFIDEESEAPKWVALELPGRDDLVVAPIGRADLAARPFRLDVDHGQVSSAPTLGSGEIRISPAEEAEIERHYRESAHTVDEASAPAHGVEPALEADRPVTAADTPLEVVRSEEDLVVDTRIVDTERVRLIKRIVTEQVTRTVEVRHEELVIEREPITGDRGLATGPTTDPEADQPVSRRERISDRLKERLPSLPAVPLGKFGAAGGAFSGETTEITLMQEEIVITKRIVPRERVHVRKEVVTEQRAVSDTLRKEQVEVDQVTGGRSTPSAQDPSGRDRLAEEI